MMAVAATVSIAITVFTHLVANQCARCGATDGAEGAAKNGIADQATGYGTYASTNLRIAGVVGAAAQGESAHNCGDQKCAASFNHVHLLACRNSNSGVTVPVPAGGFDELHAKFSLALQVFVAVVCKLLQLLSECVRNRSFRTFNLVC